MSSPWACGATRDREDRAGSLEPSRFRHPGTMRQALVSARAALALTGHRVYRAVASCLPVLAGAGLVATQSIRIGVAM